MHLARLLILNGSSRYTWASNVTVEFHSKICLRALFWKLFKADKS